MVKIVDKDDDNVNDDDDDDEKRLMVTQRKEERPRAPWPARSSLPASTSQPGEDQDDDDGEVGRDNHDEVDDCGEVGYQVPGGVPASLEGFLSF